MSPEAVVLAFRRALERQAWLEAANLVHPDDARRLQQADIRRLAGWMAAARLRQKPGVGDEAIIFVNRDVAHSHRQVEEFRQAPVTSFPTAPQLGELASLPAQGYLAKSFEAQAAEGARHGAPGPRALLLEVVATVEESPDVVRVELRAPELAGDEEEGLAEVRLHRHQGSWRLALEPDDFTAPLP